MAAAEHVGRNVSSKPNPLTSGSLHSLAQSSLNPYVTKCQCGDRLQILVRADAVDRIGPARRIRNDRADMVRLAIAVDRLESPVDRVPAGAW